MAVCFLLVLRAHLQTPVTLCREQSIRGYVSKVKVGAYFYNKPTLTNYPTHRPAKPNLTRARIRG